MRPNSTFIGYELKPNLRFLDLHNWICHSKHGSKVLINFEIVLIWVHASILKL